MLVVCVAAVRITPNPSEGQLTHFAGLNLSWAWMLQGIANALADDDPRRAMLLALADSHAAVGLPDALHPEYMVSHWAQTFALYLLSCRGLGKGAGDLLGQSWMRDEV